MPQAAKEGEKGMTAEERASIIQEITHYLRNLALIQDAENRKGDAAPTKEQSTANS